MGHYDPARGRALVIDDEPAIRELVAEFLQFLGFDAQTAASGPEGLLRLEGESYTLVITDLVMPEMTGWEVIAAIRRRTPGLAVILASGSVSNLDADRARESGVALLSKPFRLEDLKATVAAALRATEAATPPARPLAESEVAAEPPRAGPPPEELRGNAPAAGEALRRAMAWLETSGGGMQAVLGDREAWRDRWAVAQEEHRALRDAHDALARAHEATSAALGRLQAEHDGLVRLLSEVREALDASLRRLGR